MRLFVFNCLLLASVAIASPNARHKRDLAYLKNLISSAFFGRSQINIQPETVLQEEVGYKLFRIPGYEDVMIKITPKKPVVEEFVYPPVEKVNLNAFGTVVGTKTKDQTLGAVKEVDNLLSTGILYGGHNNVMKESIVPMFSAMNAGSYELEQRNTAPMVEKEVFKSRPIYEEVIETKTKPVLTKMIEKRPLIKKVIGSRPVYEEVIKERPVFKEVLERRPFYEEVIETKSKPVLTEVIEERPKFKEVIKSRPAYKEVIETRARPFVTEVIENRPIIQEVIENRHKPVLTQFNANRPDFTEVLENRPAFTEVLENRPGFTEVLENRPILEEVIETGPRQILTEVIKSRPVLTEVIETRPRPVLTEVIETRPEPVLSEVIESRPVLTDVVEEKVEFIEPFEPTYSYKQMKNNEPVMTFTAHTSPGVELLENIKMKTELPMCMKQRVYEAIVLGSDPTRFGPVQEVFQYQNPTVVDFSYPTVENSYVDDSFRGEILAEEFGYQNPPVFDFSYPKVEENSYVQRPFRGEVLTEEFDSFSGYELVPQRFIPSFQDRSERYNLRPTKTKTINPRPVPLDFHKPLHFGEDISATKDKINAKKDGVKENSQTKKVEVYSNLGEKVDVAKTLGLIPSQYITNVNNKSENAVASSIDKTKQMKAVPIVASKDNVSNAKIPNSVYRLQINPNTGESLKENGVLRTNVNPTTMAPVLLAEKDKNQERKVVYTNRVTAKPQTIKRPVKVDSANVHKITSLKEYIQNSAINKQIVAQEAKSYTYRQKNADGTSLNVNGNKHGVSVDVKDNTRGRGDIPDQ